MRQRSRRRAFTLIELLVVIAIISMLISMLTPSLSRARQQAKSAVCMASMNEIMKGLTAYGADYEFHLPPMSYQAKKDSDVLHGWSEALYQSLFQAHDYSFDEDYPVMRNREDRFKLWVCKEADPLHDSTGHYRAYELAWMRGSLDTIPYRLPVITDANPRVTDSLDLRRPDIPRLHIAGLEAEAYVDERHYGGALFSFRDGHVERSTSLKETLAVDWDLNPETPNE